MRRRQADILDAGNRGHAEQAARAFADAYGAKWLEPAAKITDQLKVLLEFYRYPADHWIHLRTTNPSRCSDLPGSGSTSRWAPEPCRHHRGCLLHTMYQF